MPKTRVTTGKSTASIAALEKLLDSEKKKNIASKLAIEKLRLQIAKLKCPYKEGDSIKIKDGGKVYSVKVAAIE